MELKILHYFLSLHSDLLDKVMLFITYLGDGGLLWICVSIMLISVSFVGKEKKQKRRTGVLIIAALLLNLILANLIIKNLVQRARPFQVDTSVIPLIFPSDYSFPSGHTSSSFAAAMILFLENKKWGSLAFLIAGLIAVSRMYLFVHYPTDILGGAVIGIISATLVWQGYKKYRRGNSDTFM